jgi:hypothetical protein
MSGKMYVGVGGVAKKVKKMYVGVGGVAKAVKKIYIGVADVAKCIFSAEGVAHYGTITSLSLVRYDLAAASTGDYALFAGGMQRYDGVTARVDAYNTSFNEIHSVRFGWAQRPVSCNYCRRLCTIRRR